MGKVLQLEGGILLIKQQQISIVWVNNVSIPTQPISFLQCSTPHPYLEDMWTLWGRKALLSICQSIFCSLMGISGIETSSTLPYYSLSCFLLPIYDCLLQHTNGHQHHLIYSRLHDQAISQKVHSFDLRDFLRIQNLVIKHTHTHHAQHEGSFKDL